MFKKKIFYEVLGLFAAASVREKNLLTHAIAPLRLNLPYLKYAAHAPSLETIHDPIGLVGVHAFPKTLQSNGFALPFKISPQIHIL